MSRNRKKNRINEALFPNRKIQGNNIYITTNGTATENSFNIPILSIETKNQTAVRRRMKWQMRKMLKEKKFEGRSPRNANFEFLKNLKKKSQRKLKKKRLKNKWGLELTSQIDLKKKFLNNEKKYFTQKKKGLFTKKAQEVSTILLEEEEKDVQILSHQKKKRKSKKKLKFKKQLSLLDKKTSMVIEKINHDRKLIEKNHRKTAIKVLNTLDTSKKRNFGDYEFDSLFQIYKPKKVNHLLKTRSMSTSKLHQKKTSLTDLASRHGSLRPSVLSDEKKKTRFWVKKNNKGFYLRNGAPKENSRKKRFLTSGEGGFGPEVKQNWGLKSNFGFDWKSFDIN